MFKKIKRKEIATLFFDQKTSPDFYYFYDFVPEKLFDIETIPGERVGSWMRAVRRRKVKHRWS